MKDERTGGAILQKQGTSPPDKARQALVNCLQTLDRLEDMHQLVLKRKDVAVVGEQPGAALYRLATTRHSRP